MTVHTLGYLGINATDLDEWRRYAGKMIAAQQIDAGDDLLYLRLDDKHHRIAIHRAEQPGGRYYGWDVGNQRELRELEQRLAAIGCSGTPGTEAECRLRQVHEMTVFSDPSGNRVELFYGQKSGCPFTPPREFGGFKTGVLGLGHVVYVSSKPQEMLEFYDVLGLRMSDYIYIQPIQSQSYFLHCNARHHSMAMVAGPMDVLHHVMLEVHNLDDVGMAYDIAQRMDVNITMTLGKHTNDKMISFYSQTPSGFELEYGYGAITIDDEDSWQVVEYDDISFWGHHGPMRQPEPI